MRINNATVVTTIVVPLIVIAIAFGMYLMLKTPPPPAKAQPANPVQDDQPSFGSPPPPTEAMQAEQKSAFQKLGAAREATADGKPLDEVK